MSHNKNLFIGFAASPLHLMCIKELIERNKSSQFLIYNLLYKKNTMVNKQISGTVEILKIKNLINIYLHPNKFLSALKKLHLAFKIYSKYKKQNPTFVIIDFRNTFMHFLRKLFFNSNFILVDDGFSTYIHYHKYIKRNIYLPYMQYNNFIGKINKFIHFGFSFKKILYKEFKLFTMYAKELGLPDEDYNNFSFIKKSLLNKKLKYSKSIVFFSGTKLVERGALTMEQELSIVRKLKKYWSKKNKKLIYIAKRTSSQNKLDLIKKLVGVEVISFDLPIELALLSKNFVLPFSIISLGSTVNQTIPMIFDKINIHLVVIDEIHKNKDLEEDISYSKEIFSMSNSRKNIIKINY